MNRGYVNIWRKSLDNDLIRNALAWQLMTWMLLKAAHAPRKILVGTALVELEPGQLVVGRSSLARELKSTERKIRTSLELLEKCDFLTIKATNKFSVVSIIIWHLYQDDRPANDQQGANKRPASDHE